MAGVSDVPKNCNFERPKVAVTHHSCQKPEEEDAYLVTYM